MFNKTSVFGSKDNIPRHDPKPVLGNGSRPATPTSVTNAATTKDTTVNPTPITSPAKPATGSNGSNGAAPATVAASTDPSAVENVMGARLIVGPDVKLKGAEILDCDTLVVEGRVEATMDSRVIRIAENGSFAGKVSIDIAEIHGVFEGELTARSQLIIHSTGRVSGTIRFGKLVVDEGGELGGDVNVISAKAVSHVSQVRPVVEPFITLSAAVG